MTSLQPDARLNWGGRSQRRIGIWFVLFGSQAFGCSSPVAPRRLPTVLVTNATCDSGRCATLEIRAFIWKFAVPGQLPWGFGVVGEAPPGERCLTFPPSWSLTVIGDTIVGDTTGQVDTVIVTWTPDDTFPINLVAVDSAFFHGGLDSARIDSLKEGLLPYFDGVGFGRTVGETPKFAPGSSAGWSATFPSTPPWSARLVAGEACKP